MQSVRDSSRPHDLYRFYDADDRLLYVGISLNAAQRASSHRADKPWWDEVARMDVEHLGDVTRQDAEATERLAIIDGRPAYNVIWNAGTSVRSPQTRKRKRNRRAGAPPAERWQHHWAYAFGLRDGSCPVGLISRIWLPDEHYPRTTLEVDLYQWMIGFFTAGTISIDADEIISAAKAERFKEDGEWVFHMDPLGDFQTAWKRRAG